MRRPLREALAGLLASLALVACHGGSSQPDAGGGDAGGDAGPVGTPPVVQDVRVQIDGDPPLSIDLNGADVQQVLPVPTQSEVTVLADDDRTSRDALTVEAVGADGSPIDLLDRTYNGGLWRLTLMLAPGMTMSVRVIDGDGQATDAPHSLVISTLQQAVTDAWRRPFFAPDQSVRYLHHLTFTADGNFTETRDDTGLQRGGTYSIMDGSLALEERWRHVVAPIDNDPSTIESRRTALLHVDEQDMALDAFVRMGGTGTGLAGTWQRTWTLEQASGGTLAPAEDGTETWTLGSDGSYSGQRTVVLNGGSSTDMTQEQGTYQIVLNGDYSSGVGNFLSVTVTQRDGATLSPAEQHFELYAVSAGRLLISPWLRGM